MRTVVKEIYQGLKTAVIDLLATWGAFAASRFREAYDGRTPLPPSVSPLMREIGNGQPFFSSVIKYARANPTVTFYQLYKGSGTYFFTAYAWLVGAEFGVKGVAERAGLTDCQSTLLTGIVGGIVATPGEHHMVQGRTVAQLWQRGMLRCISETRGWLPTIGREVIFSAVALSQIQNMISKKIANTFNNGCKSFWTDFIGILGCAPLLALTQPPSRIAANMQLTNNGFFAVNKELCQLGKETMMRLPKKTSLVNKSIAFFLASYFPGGGLRVSALVGTGLIYGLMKPSHVKNDDPEWRSAVRSF